MNDGGREERRTRSIVVISPVRLNGTVADSDITLKAEETCLIEHFWFWYYSEYFGVGGRKLTTF